MLLHEVGGELPDVAVPDHAFAVQEEVGGQPQAAVQRLDPGGGIEADGVVEIVAEGVLADRYGGTQVVGLLWAAPGVGALVSMSTSGWAS